MSLVSVTGNDNRFAFCEMLRGIAVWLVVVSHYLGVFWSSQDTLSKLLGYEKIDGVYLSNSAFFVNNQLIFGQLGVALFFLISGFVISISLERYSKVGFLLNRAARIYPVYVAGLLILVFGLYLVDGNGDGIPYTITHLVVHSLIVVRQWLGFQKIDGISWTLEIELFFYVMLFFLVRFRAANYLTIVLYALFALVFLSLLFGQIYWYIGRQVAMLSYMLIGVLFFLYHKGEVSKKRLFLVIFLSVAMLMLFFSITPIFSDQPLMWVAGYVVAPVIFYYSYSAHVFRRPIVGLAFFAKISYPLYATHAVFGYAMIYLMLKSGFSPWGAVATTTSLVILVSYVVHVLVEKPSIQLSRRFNR